MTSDDLGSDELLSDESLELTAEAREQVDKIRADALNSIVDSTHQQLGPEAAGLEELRTQAKECSRANKQFKRGHTDPDASTGAKGAAPKATEAGLTHTGFTTPPKGAPPKAPPTKAAPPQSAPQPLPPTGVQATGAVADATKTKEELRAEVGQVAAAEYEEGLQRRHARAATKAARKGGGGKGGGGGGGSSADGNVDGGTRISAWQSWLSPPRGRG